MRPTGMLERICFDCRIQDDQAKMRKVERQQVAAVLRKQDGAGQAVFVCRAEVRPIEAERIEPLARRQIEDPDLPVVALGNVEGAIVRGNGRAQEDAFRVVIVGIESGGNLRHLGLLAASPVTIENRKRLGAAVDGHQRLAVRAKRQPIRMRRNFDLPAERSNQPPAGQDGLPVGINFGRPVSRRRRQGKLGILLRVLRLRHILLWPRKSKARYRTDRK